MDDLFQIVYFLLDVELQYFENKGFVILYIVFLLLRFGYCFMFVIVEVVLEEFKLKLKKLMRIVVSGNKKFEK